MTKQELTEELKKMHRPGDPEGDHSKADKLLLEFIADEEITTAFELIEKWYA